jgi:hypothetical protein
MEEGDGAMTERRKAEESVVYRIKVEGRMDERWSDWFSGLAVVAGGEGEGAPVTTLTGLMDQAALRGILNKVWDLNLTLMSVIPVKANKSYPESTSESHPESTNESHPEPVEG